MNNASKSAPDARTNIHYTIVSGYNAGEVAIKVNSMLQRGWELQGGVTMSLNSSGSQYFAQAMIQRVT